MRSFSSQMASHDDLAVPSSKSASCAVAPQPYKARQARPTRDLAIGCHFGSGRYDESVAVALDYQEPPRSFCPPQRFLPSGLKSSWTHAKIALDRQMTAHKSP